MMTFAEAPAFFRGIIYMTFFLQFILLVAVLIVNFRQKRVFPVFLRNFILILMCGMVFLLYQLGVGLETSVGELSMEYARWFGSYPFWGILMLSTILFLELAVYLAYSFFWAGKHITASSVKEAIDNLPGGICIYEDTGRPLIKNRAIVNIAREMTGLPLLDGLAFEEAVKNYKKNSRIGDKYVIFLPDDSVWAFTFDTLKDGVKKYSFVLCSDISEEYKKTQELEETQMEVMSLNVKLTKYNQEIISTISEKEVLNAKVKIHDELGTGLLAIKHYLTQGGSEEEKAQIIDRIMRNINYLKSETEHQVSDEYELMLTTAHTLGVGVEIDGKLPDEEPGKHIVATAIHECFTNTLRHAGGDRLFIKIEKEDRRLEISFRNNGEQPKDIINEKGGLLSLHSLVTQSGGEMEIISMPEFVLKISLPVKEEN